MKNALMFFGVIAWLSSCGICDDKSNAPPFTVAPVSSRVRVDFQLDNHYQKMILVSGFPIVGSAKVKDEALCEAACIVRAMLVHRPDVLRKLAENRIRLGVMSVDERTTDLPEHSDLTPAEYWNRRARGLGPTQSRPAVSCGEENLLHNSGDPYYNESILVHEFAHAIHTMAISQLDPTFDHRLEQIYKSAMRQGLWQGLYAAKNKEEYFAEAVQSWFNTNRENDDIHNHVNTREELIQYDSDLAELCADVFGKNSWRYVRSDDPSRLTEPHLRQLSRATLKKFEWGQ